MSDATKSGALSRRDFIHAAGAGAVAAGLGLGGTSAQASATRATAASGGAPAAPYNIIFRT